MIDSTGSYRGVESMQGAKLIHMLIKAIKDIDHPTRGVPLVWRGHGLRKEISRHIFGAHLDEAKVVAMILLMRPSNGDTVRS